MFARRQVKFTCEAGQRLIGRVVMRASSLAFPPRCLASATLCSSRHPFHGQYLRFSGLIQRDFRLLHRSGV